MTRDYFILDEMKQQARKSILSNVDMTVCWKFIVDEDIHIKVCLTAPLLSSKGVSQFKSRCKDMVYDCYDTEKYLEEIGEDIISGLIMDLQCSDIKVEIIDKDDSIILTPRKV